MIPSLDDPWSYQRGYAARQDGEPKVPPPHLEPDRRAHWLAGWHDADIAKNGYGHYVPARHTRRAG